MRTLGVLHLLSERFGFDSQLSRKWDSSSTGRALVTPGKLSLGGSTPRRGLTAQLSRRCAGSGYFTQFIKLCQHARAVCLSAAQL